MEDSEIVEEAEITNGATAREEYVDIVASDVMPRDNAIRIELMLLHREKELWERESSSYSNGSWRRNSPTMISTESSNGTIPAPGGVKNIKGLLLEFDGTDNAF